jgi:hypothetical protein
MAKRTRGSARPGQRRPAARTASRPRPNTVAGPARPNELPARRPTGLDASEEARAAELEAQIVAEERAAEADRRRSSQRSRDRDLVDETRGRSRGAVMLGTRAAEEYTYVVRDVRRIVTIGGGLLAVLFALWILIDIAKVVQV